MPTHPNTPQVDPGIDIKSLFEKVGFVPHSQAQWDYCLSPARFNVPCCGRRWGKSLATGHKTTHKVFIPDSYTWIVGPTYKLGEKEFRVVYSDFRKLGLLKYCKKAYSVKQGDMRIETPWNSVIEVVSAEKPDGLLGEGLTHAVMSEAARHDRATWEQFIEPALSDLLGSCDFPSTPKGYNWYHGLWMLGQQPEHSDYASWSFPSWSNPVRYPGGLTNPEILRIMGTVSKAYFDQEYGAKFTSYAGQIYEEFDKSKHVKPHTFRPDWANYQAFDYGFANPFVCLDVQVGPDDTVYVWREYVMSYRSTYEHGEYLAHERENPPGYHVDGRWGDPRGSDEAATLALVLGHVAFDDVPWKHGVEAIKRLMKNNKLIIDPSCVITINQLEQLHVKEQKRSSQDLSEVTGDGNIQHKVNDHTCDALRYLVGPLFVRGAGSHLSDIYGESYHGSEAEDMFTTIHNQITMGDDLASDLVRFGYGN